MALERVIKFDLLLEDDIDATREFFLDECTSDGRVLLPSLSLIEAFDLGEILNGTPVGEARALRPRSPSFTGSAAGSGVGAWLLT